ncbi:potassium channel family protein [Algiphilus sp.]|uniref:potassium channel family protein n=1 Tax=Algiphilus sp. TaxID=1872431 RepID=UPI003B5177F8
MEGIIWIVVRRIRAPLILLIVTYSISIAGLVLIPGMDENGEPTRLDFLHAFYFVSYMGSTIGFGEIPHPFTPAQRLWVTLCIFLTVIAWLYAIGRIISLIQEPRFRSAIAEAGFVRAVRKITEPFWVICGYGETGTLLVRALHRRGIQCVVMDPEESAINQLRLEPYGASTPALCGSATDTLQLLEAGMRRRLCYGVIAMTDDNDDNIRISVTAKLIRPELTVIARAGTREAADNLASFDTDHVIHPYTVFSEHLAMVQQRPSLHLLHAALISPPNRPIEGPTPPPQGRWIVCGYGRFGRAATVALEDCGNEVTVIERNPDKAPPGAIVGLGTESGPLCEAGVRDAVGIVCGTDSDPNTLSAVLTARALNPDIYVIARQDRRADSTIYGAAKIDLIMEVSRLTVWRVLPLIKAPLLARFLEYMRTIDEHRAQSLMGRLRALTDDVTPETWTISLDATSAPALLAALRDGETVTLGTLLRNPSDRNTNLHCMPLMLHRAEEDFLQPQRDLALQPGDAILLAARPGTRRCVERALYDAKELAYLLHGVDHPDGWLWRWWSQRRARKAGGEG